MVKVIDGLDGTEVDQAGIEEVLFALDATAYVVNLSRTTRVPCGPRCPATPRQPATTTNPGSGGSGRKDLDQVRGWVNSNGYTDSTPCHRSCGYDAR